MEWIPLALGTGHCCLKTKHLPYTTSDAICCLLCMITVAINSISMQCFHSCSGSTLYTFRNFMNVHPLMCEALMSFPTSAGEVTISLETSPEVSITSDY